MNWIRRQPKGGATLPIWWVEWYSSAPDGASLAYHTAVMADGLIQTLRGRQGGTALAASSATYRMAMLYGPI
jgi:hypothetical protein